MAIDWTQLVSERQIWVNHNFPGVREPLDSVIGCIEELGELSHAHLKQVQSIRGTDEEHVASAKDSIGDLAVYLLGVISFVDNPVVEFNQGGKALADDALLKLGEAVGGLAAAMFDLRGRSKMALEDLSSSIPYVILFSRDYCVARDWDYEAIVRETWAAVSKRDWIKFPFDGLTK